jgi:hypothetical protein
MKIDWSQFRSYSDNNLDDVPTQAGVYLLWMKMAKDEWRMFFVGNADCLRLTLKRHLTSAEPNKIVRRKIINCVTGFEYSVQTDPGVRDRVIRFLATQYRPECGSAPVAETIEPLEVNLP